MPDLSKEIVDVGGAVAVLLERLNAVSAAQRRSIVELAAYACQVARQQGQAPPDTGTPAAPEAAQDVRAALAAAPEVALPAESQGDVFAAGAVQAANAALRNAVADQQQLDTIGQAATTASVAMILSACRTATATP